MLRQPAAAGLHYGLMCSRCDGFRVVFLFVFVALSFLFFFSSSFAAFLSFRAPVSAVTVQTDVDPDILDSEFNHRLAGYALFLISLLIIAGHASPRLAFLQYVWPLIFIAVGILLAVWSDKEMWPRGLAQPVVAARPRSRSTTAQDICPSADRDGNL